MFPLHLLESYIQENKGDIVEIGAGYGEHTLEFLQLAEKYNRDVVVIDPFNNDMPETYRYDFSIFWDKVKEYSINLIVHKKTSLCKTSEEICKREIAFAYVDGLQFKGAVLNDLRIVSHASIICVDDMDRETEESQVPSAVYDFIKQTGKNLLILERWAIIK